MKLKIAMILIFILTNGILYYTNTQTKNERIDLILNEQIKDLETHYNLTMDYFIQDAKTIKNNIDNNKKIIKLFSQAQNATKEQRDILRDKLYKLLAPQYGRIHSRGILQFQFVFPDNKCFLRMHKPSKYGDDLTNIRYSFKQANKTKETIIGFEQGRTTHAFRYAYPYYDKQGNHLGAIETSLSSHFLQEKLLSVNKIHSHFLVNKNIFDVKAWETKDLIQKYMPSIEHKDYMFALTNHSNKGKLINKEKTIISKLREQINNKIALKKPFAVYKNLEHSTNIITFLPITNTQQKDVVAYVVSYNDNQTIYNIIKDYNKANIVRLVGLLLLCYFIYRNLNYKNELEEEVELKTKSLNNKNTKLQEQAKILTQIHRELEDSEYELEEINKNLENRIIEEVEKNKHIQEQLFKSEKLASMGDMIGNIAHQWRQPLSVISTASTGIVMQKEYGILDETNLIDTCNKINDNAQYLSKTIDDFKNFIKGDRTKKLFSLKKDVDSFLHLVEGSIKTHNINMILDLQEDIKIDGYENELTQCLINIFNNAKDELIKKDTNVSFDSTNKKNYNNEDRLIFITTSTNKDKAIIKIKDNGGGILKDILPKVFEPYFTTKHQSQGTGLGLHMTYNLIVDGMNGTIEATNDSFEYGGKNYTGAEFIITLPLS
ncbi:MAG: ATP-binding protein [Campylobacterota bacterium]|nr:ATP-binding protein [Campylobacterota bacterium]